MSPLPAGSQVGNVMVSPDIQLVPAFGAGWQDGFTKDDELLYSAVGYTQKGVTLAPGQGILPLGTVLARNSSTKLWVVYNNGDPGADVARGILRKSVDTGTDAGGKRLQANIVIRGILKNSKISGADAGAITDLAARVDTVLGTFTF